MKNVSVIDAQSGELIAQIFVNEDGEVNAIKKDNVDVIVDGSKLKPSHED